mmetsp:Transcript_9827/g.8662  ORF Transcript_9827/g.8662 Transcript_9827/m.8662 type:complete len:99 (-) Transcript_9827:517-813(-)
MQSKYFEYKHDFLDKLQNQNESNLEEMVEDSYVDDSNIPTDSHNERIGNLREMMNDTVYTDSEYNDIYDEEEPTFEVYAGENEFKQSLIENCKKRVNS